MSNLLGIFDTKGLIGTITEFLGTLLYPLFSIIFAVIDAVQSIFYRFAGIENMSFNGTPITSGNSGMLEDTGIVYYLMQHEIVKNMFISILLLAIFLMVIFTVMAFIKNVYAAKPKGWKDIIANSIKGLANFIFIPVCCLLGVWLGNILLQAINGATSYNGATSMGRKLFISCSYNANVFRANKDDADWNIEYNKFQALVDNSIILSGEDKGKRYSEVHTIEEIKTKEVYDGFLLSEKKVVIDKESYDYCADIVDDVYANTDADINWYWNVGTFYSLWQINYIILVVGGIFMFYVLGSLSFAMIKRLFYILVLFVISPAVCALYPLDEGKQVGTWKGEFIKQVLSAYGAVAGLNIFFSLLPLIDRLEIVTLKGANYIGVNYLVNLFVLVTGLLIVKDLIGLISGFAGGDNAYSTGSGLMKSAAKEVGGRYGKAINNTVGAFSRAAGAGKKGGFKAGLKSFFVDSAGKGALGLANKITKTISAGALDPAEIGKTAGAKYAEGFNAAKADADGKFGEKKAKEDAGKYSKFDASGLYSKFSDDVKKVVFDDAKNNYGTQFSELGIDGKKQDEAMKDVTVADNLINMLKRINDAAKVAEQSWKDLNDHTKLGYINLSAITSDQKKLFDEALAAGKQLKTGDGGFTDKQIGAFNEYIAKANAAKVEQDRYNKYAETNQDTISGNEKLLNMVTQTQANIQTQQSSGVYSKIDELAVGADVIRTASSQLATAFKSMAANTEKVKKTAKQNAREKKPDKS